MWEGWVLLCVSGKRRKKRLKNTLTVGHTTSKHILKFQAMNPLEIHSRIIDTLKDKLADTYTKLLDVTYNSIVSDDEDLCMYSFGTLEEEDEKRIFDAFGEFERFVEIYKEVRLNQKLMKEVSTSYDALCEVLHIVATDLSAPINFTHFLSIMDHFVGFCSGYY